jgi:hypothetical protein
MRTLKDLRNNPDDEDDGIFEEYIDNVLESFLVLVIIRAVVDKPINFIHVFKSSLIVAGLISIATYLNRDFKDNVRQGLHYGVSTIIVGQFSPII